MLAGIPASLLAGVPPAVKPKALPRVGEFFPFLDPVTENPVVRLTNPNYVSFLPPATNRFVSIKERSLIFSSDRTGSLAPFQVNLRTGILTQLSNPRKLAPESLCLNAKGNAVYLLDGDTLQEITLGNHKMRSLADGVSSFCELGTASGSEPSFVVVRQGRLEILGGSSGPLAENVANFCLSRPDGRGCLFMRESTAASREFWYAPMPGAAGQNPVLLASGKLSNPIWTRDGHDLLFLREREGTDPLASEIHAANPEAPGEQTIARTSQFAAFSPNGDASVFVGASRSKAQPTVLLLLASVQRELTLCEHRASHPAAVSPVFSPDSKRVYFQSDHEGKSALYSVNVERLIEPTPDNE